MGLARSYEMIVLNSGDNTSTDNRLRGEYDVKPTCIIDSRVPRVWVSTFCPFYGIILRRSPCLIIDGDSFILVISPAACYSAAMRLHE